eukprot:gene20880-27067_t
MPPKSQEKTNKKAIREKANQVIDDASFGLKNKNKSKKVQQFITRVEKSVKGSSGITDAAKAKEALKEAKLAKQLQEEELRALLNEGISNQYGKKKSQSQNTAALLGISEASEEVTKLLEEFSSDSEDDDDTQKKNKGPETYYIDDDPVSVEVFREKTIEDIIEEQRLKLSSEGKKGTPVTAETFAIWRASKLAKRQAEAEARVKAEQSKKKGGKGLSVLSGKELFNYNSSLFIDDEAALDAQEENQLALETKHLEEIEEANAKVELERAQLEQERLQYIQQIEIEELNRKYEEKRRRALDPNHITFIIDNIIINEVIFEEDELEDLTPFPELVENINTNQDNDNYDIVVSNQYENDDINFNNNEDKDADDEEEDEEIDDEEDYNDDSIDISNSEN